MAHVVLRTRAATLFLAVLGCSPSPTIEMTDVSPVWPLPEGDAPAEGFLTASSEGAFGALLPREIFDAIPTLTITDEPDDLYENLVVVGARLDPCFREGKGVPPCQSNVRLVFQPVRPAVEDEDEELGEIVARDAAVHAFYKAEGPEEVVDAVVALSLAREETGGDGSGPLRVSPLLEDAEGRARVRDVLLSLLGEGRLTRVTSTGVHAGNTAWTFSGFDIANGERHAISIPLTDGAEEQHVISDGASGAMHAIIEPPPDARNDFAILLDEAAAQTSSPADRQDAFDAAAIVENPLLNNPGTVDCASCHLAAAARVAAVAREALAPSPLSYSSTRHDLTPTDAFTDSRVVRAFGYRFRHLALSPRVVHESAAVADGISARLP